jgi:penicillin-binding protein 2
MMNKAIQAQMAPGSVFKIVTSAAALETGTSKPDFSVQCGGAVNFYGHLYHDHKTHGGVNLQRAIEQSCDVFFYTVGKMTGIEQLAYFATRMGLGRRTGIDLPGEAPGIMPSPEWVQRVFKRKWYAGETISVAIGQGAVTVTPIQLTEMIGGVSIGGVFNKPHLVFRDQLLALGVNVADNPAREFPLSQNTVDALKQGMWGVVNDGGTGGQAHCPEVSISSKTGTAQVVSADLQASAKNKDYNNNAWFVGYGPSDNPEIVVGAMVVGGGHSTVAVPMVRDVIRTYIEKKSGPKPPGNQMETQVRILSQLQPHN